jgi:putative tryptophan/tyrosine transport system substrate-binding protein
VAGRHPVRAQQKSLPVIGYLEFGKVDPKHPILIAFHNGLKESGYVEGQNVTFEYRWADRNYDRVSGLAEELVGRNPDVIVAMGDVSVRAVARATSTIPVVFITGTDPVQTKLVASLARPGGNLTGITEIATEMLSKRIDLLLELHPKSSSVALLVNPVGGAAGMQSSIQFAEEAANAKGVKLVVIKASDEPTLNEALALVKEQQIASLIVNTDAFFFIQRKQIIEWAVSQMVPAIFELKEFVTSGGLISYGPDLRSLRYQVGVYAGKVLRGAKPSELPIQQPTKFELAINLKTAKAIGIDIAPALLARADEVIE